MPGRERNATHRNTEKLFTQPSSLHGEIAMGEIHSEPENAFGNEARAHGELHGAAGPAAPQLPCLHAGQRAGELAHCRGTQQIWKSSAVTLPASPFQCRYRLMLQHEAISCSFPGTFHMVPLLHYLLAYPQGLLCPLKCSHLPTQRLLYIYSPPSDAAFDGRNHRRSPRLVQSPRFQDLPPKDTQPQPLSPARGKLERC